MEEYKYLILVEYWGAYGEKEDGRKRSTSLE